VKNDVGHRECYKVDRVECVLVEPLGLMCCLERGEKLTSLTEYNKLQKHMYNFIPGGRFLMNSQEEDLSLFCLTPAKR
jgi:hypothetical protein